MKKIVLPIATIAASLLFNLSCSKNSGSSAPPCKLITLTEVDGTSTTTTNITYNSDNKIATSMSTTVDGGITSTDNAVYTYAGNLIMKTSTSIYNGGTPSTSTDSIALNSAGYVIADMERYSTGGSYYLTTYTYDNNNKLLKTTSQSGSNPPTTSIVTYSGGDLSMITEGTDTTYLYYNTNKASNNNDYLYLLQNVQYGGARIFNTAHQLKALKNPGSAIVNFDYTYDGKGNLATMTYTQGSDIQTYSIQYDCSN